MSPQSEHATAAFVRGSPEYDSAERELLLRAARAAIDGAFFGRELDIAAPSVHLAEVRGAFTTLHLDGELRGCVGYVFASYPLYRTVLETAIAAAFGDNRFEPVTVGEAQRLKIEISVLSPMFEISPSDVVVGLHGLLISKNQLRGLLLPQVPVEHGWDSATFLSETCRKAGLPGDAWKQGAKIEAFTAEIFGDR